MEAGNLYWKFMPVDDFAYKQSDIDESRWYTIKLTDDWKDHHEFNDYRGLGWYRLHIHLSEVKDYAVFIPKSFRGIQIYLNGNFVGETRDFTSTGYTPPTIGLPQSLLLPAYMWNKGDNVFAIRIGELDGFSSMGPGFKIGPVENIRDVFALYILRYGVLSFISLFLSIFYTFYFYYRKMDKYYIYFAGTCFFLGLWIAGYSALIMYFYDSYFLYVLTTYIGGLIVPFFFINFIHSFLDVRKNVFKQFFEIIYLSLAATLFLNLLIKGNIRFFNLYLYDIFSLFNIMILVYSIWITILEVKRKTPYALRILTGILIFGVTIVLLFILWLFRIMHVSVYVIEGFFLMNIIFASVLAERFARVHTDLEKTHSELVILDKIKDEALENLNIYKNIVSTTQEQMAFINRNYTVLAVNEQFIKAFHKGREEIVNRSLVEVFGKVEFEKNIKGCCDQCLRGDIVHFEKWYDYPVLGRKYMVVVMYPFIAERSDIKGIVLNLMDNTEKFLIEKSVVDISQNERRNIGIELHDGLSQKLLSIAIRTSMLSNRLSNNSLGESSEAKEIEKLLNSAVEDTRNLARGLFPIDLEVGGIDAFTRELQQRIEEKYNVSFNIDIDESIKIEDILVYTQLYYITQEAVYNAAHHSGGKNIDISLKYDEDGHVVLSIMDDGIGMPDNLDEDKGIGLNIMKYRARMIGASLNVSSGDNGGTQVVCRL
ncbi:MAG: ATP-binding protein [Promethearchaeota archaeon]